MFSKIEILSSYGIKQALNKYKNSYIENFDDNDSFTFKHVEISNTSNNDKFIMKISNDEKLHLKYTVTVNEFDMQVTRHPASLFALFYIKSTDKAAQRFLDEKIKLYHWELGPDADPENDLSYEEALAVKTACDLMMVFPKKTMSECLILQGDLSSIKDNLKKALRSFFISPEDKDYEQRLRYIEDIDFNVTDKGKDILDILQTMAVYDENDRKYIDSYYQTFVDGAEPYLGKPERIYTTAEPLSEITRKALSEISYYDSIDNLCFIKFPSHFMAVLIGE